MKPDQLLKMARDLDRFSRRFERFCVVQLEQLEAAVQKLDREKTQWERQRARDLKQIQDHRRMLQDAWAELRDGGATDGPVEAPQFESETEDPEHFCMKSATDPLRLLLSPGDGGEMLIGQLLLTISRLNRAHGGCGVRFELSECHEHNSGQAILELDAFPARPLVALSEGDVSDDVLRWQRYKKSLTMMPLGRGLSEKLKHAVAAPRDHATAVLFTAAARRASDGDARTASSVKRGSRAITEYSEQLNELVERHRHDGLALQVVTT